MTNSLSSAIVRSMLFGHSWIKIILVFFVTTPLSLRAQEGASEFLKLLELHQKSLPFKQRFTQVKSMKEMGVELPSEGELEVKSIGNAIWKITKPSYLSVEVSPEEIRVFSTPNSVPRVLKKDGSGLADHQGGDWMELLMQKPDNVAKHFSVVRLAPLKFRLVPLSKKRSFDFVELLFTRTAKISEVFIQENKDDSLKIRFQLKGS